jgi:hypothetical protein
MVDGALRSALAVRRATSFAAERSRRKDTVTPALIPLRAPVIVFACNGLATIRVAYDYRTPAAMTTSSSSASVRPKSSGPDRVM